MRFAPISLLLVVCFLGASACQNAALVSAQREAAAGQYDAAHRDYEAALHRPGKLDQQQRRQALDGVCLTEYLIGPPNYSLDRQYSDCAKAAAEPGSESGGTLIKIEKLISNNAEFGVEQALLHHDLNEAIWSAREYSLKPGASRAKLNQFSDQIWGLIASRERTRTPTSRRRLRPAISTLSRENPHLRNLSRREFERWVRRELTVNGQPLVTSLAVKGSTLHLWVPESAMPVLALNLERLSRVNDGMAVWCGCDARTDVGMSGTQLPAYLLRLDPDTARSQVLVLGPG